MNNREKLHRILDLILDLNEQAVTHATMNVHGHVQSVSVMVYEGECTDGNMLTQEYAYYDGELKNEKKVNDIIRELEELRDEI